MMKAEHMIAITEPSANQWLFQMVESMPHESFVKLAVTLWATWWPRRKVIHERVFQSPLTTNFVKSVIAELGEVTIRTTSTHPRVTTRRSEPAHMIAPPPGYAKIHVDAGLRRDGDGGSVAAVCRDSSGNYLRSSSLVIQGV